MAPDKTEKDYARVEIRLSGIEEFVNQRVGSSMGATTEGRVVKRDLGRFYFLLRLYTPKFSLEEAMMMVDIFNGGFFQGSHDVFPIGFTLIPDSVSDALADGYVEKWGVNGDALVERLYRLHPFELMAIADAIERAWNSPTYTIIDMGERVRAVGLARES